MTNDQFLQIVQDLNETEEAMYMTFAELQNTLEDSSPSQKQSSKVMVLFPK